MTKLLYFLTIFIVGVNCNFNNKPEALEQTPVSINQLPGITNIPGAFLLSRISLNFLNITCDDFLKNMETTILVLETLNKYTLKNATSNHKSRYAYEILQVESEILEILEYLTQLLLCPYDSRVILWDTLRELRKKLPEIWAELKTISKSKKPKPNRPNFSVLDHIIPKHKNNPLISYLEKARPKKINSPKQPKIPLLVGLGLGFLGSFPFWDYFGSSNDQEIDDLNKRINQHYKFIKLTNERIDLLVKSLSTVHNNVKDILDKLITNQEYFQLHYAIVWNFDQIRSNLKEIKNTFKLGELTITLLEQGILNAELVDLKSFKIIIEEGLKTFSHLEFPLEISRHTLHHIVKMIKIQRVDHQKFLMVIPLTIKQRYEAYKLVAHPLKISETTLVLPNFRKIMLINDEETYISTIEENIYSINSNEHLLLDIEPIHSQTKNTCEWSAFKQNAEDMINLCNYEKLGLVNDTFVIETNTHRIVYFSNTTQVTIECPNRTYRDKLIGLHKVQLSCDIITDQVIWPSKQTLTINLIEPVEETDNYETRLPMLQINKTSKVHSSLKDLLRKLPDEEDSLTIDFDYYGLSNSQVQTYTVYSQATLLGLIIINSCITAFLLTQWIYNKKSTQIKGFSRKIRDSSFNEKFRGLRDSVGSRINQSQRLNRMRDSIRSRSSRLRRSNNSPQIPLKTLESANNRKSEELSLKPKNKDLNSYPALPRYI